MIFVKSAMVLFIVSVVLIPIAIYLMLRKPGTFDNAKKMVKKQYPSLFHARDE